MLVTIGVFFSGQKTHQKTLEKLRMRLHDDHDPEVPIDAKVQPTWWFVWRYDWMAMVKTCKVFMFKWQVAAFSEGYTIWGQELLNGSSSFTPFFYGKKINGSNSVCFFNLHKSISGCYHLLTSTSNGFSRPSLFGNFLQLTSRSLGAQLYGGPRRSSPRAEGAKMGFYSRCLGRIHFWNTLGFMGLLQISYFFGGWGWSNTQILLYIFYPSRNWI